ncbi:hypothetical protein [Halococcus thailandensis]|uniref:Transmembrane protein n=1 Tax=Halococcus thailandensis JCM 13552 TaxID=1227457 RepID=M0NF21_9EURY|nr:hypothetical protein [Halococcus thailandensis]EMA56153.1 hypothetical protein C451_03924 [Halococcus thailandensis JCM 13552]
MLADVELITEGVEAGTIQLDVFSGQRLVDVTYAMAWWSGVGLLVTGVATWLAAVGFGVYRRRAHRRQETSGEVLRSTRPNTTPSMELRRAVRAITTNVSGVAAATAGK